MRDRCKCCASLKHSVVRGCSVDQMGICIDCSGIVDSGRIDFDV